MNDNLDQFNVLRKIKSNPNSSQRKLASELGFSLKNLNYCLKSLSQKGLIKIKNFHKNPNKIGYHIFNPKRFCCKNSINIKFYEKKNERI